MFSEVVDDWVIAHRPSFVPSVAKPVRKGKHFLLSIRDFLLCENADSYWLVSRPVSDVMLMRLPWEGERCSGGVRQALAESSSPLGNTNSPIRTLSRLPSSTPLPSHRPHGNLMDNKVLRLHIEAPHLLASFYLFFWFSEEIFYIWLAINKHAEWFLLTCTWCASEDDSLNVVQTHRRAKSTRFHPYIGLIFLHTSLLWSSLFVFCMFYIL